MFLFYFLDWFDARFGPMVGTIPDTLNCGCSRRAKKKPNEKFKRPSIVYLPKDALLSTSFVFQCLLQSSQCTFSTAPESLLDTDFLVFMNYCESITAKALDSNCGSAIGFQER